MRTHRQDGAARIGRIGRRDVLVLGLLMVAAGVWLSSLFWTVPLWLYMTTWAIVVLLYVVQSLPAMRGALLDLRSSIPRVDPDYRRRR